MDEASIFLKALQKAAPEQRAAYLEEACGADEALRRNVERLLKAHVKAGDFLAQAPVAVGVTVDEPLSERPGTAIGPYKLLEPIGEGGMGTVWMAQQTEPVKRLVAVKLIKAGMDSRQVIARFEAERQALALMDHPNIAKVFDGGTAATGRPYFVMELVKGVPLTKYCDDHRLTPRQRLELFLPVCQAIQHAHQKGIIHRDIKPSNVLVAQYDGKPVPKVIDFGIAKATGQQLTEQTLITGFGAVVGTLEYMSPEQAEVNQLDIDTRSDIYSLGVLLYELLTGTTPLEKKRLKEAAMLEVLRLIREEEPPRPSTRLSTTEELPSIAANRGLEPKRLTGLVRGELDWIVMKALEKDRSRRYESASAFSADVQRYLNDEPVLACPPSAWYRLRKFARRHKAALTTTALVVTALVTVLIGLIVSELRVREEHRTNERTLRDKATAEEQRANAEKERGDKERERAETNERWRQTAYYLQIAMAFDAYRANKVARAKEILAQCQPDMHHWEWQYLNRLCNSELSRVEAGQPDALTLRRRALSQDGGRLAIVDGKNILHVYDTATSEEKVTFPIHAQLIDEVVFSPDSKRLVTLGASGLPAGPRDCAYVWDAATGEKIADLSGVQYGRVPSTPGLWGAAFSPDGKLLAGTDKKGNLFLWDVATGKERFPHVAAHPLPNATPATVWSTKVAFHPDGTLLATACGDDRVVKLWDATTGNLVRSLEQGPGFGRVTFSPKGKWVAATGKWMIVSDPDLSVWVWDAQTGRRQHILRGHTQPVAGLAFSPDETQLATGSLDGTLTLWDVATGQEVGTYRGHDRDVRAVAYSPDGKRVVSLDSERVVRRWDATRGPEYASLKCRGAWQATISPDGRRIAAAVSNFQGGLIVWDAETGDELAKFAEGADKEAVRMVALSPGGKLVAAAVSVGIASGVVRVWDVSTGQLVRSRSQAHRIGQVYGVYEMGPAAAPAGGGPMGAALVMLGAYQGANWAGVGLVRNLPEQGPAAPCDAVAWSPDGKLIASGGQDRVVRLWDAATGEQLQALTGHARTISAAIFSRDGKRLVSASGGITRSTPVPLPGELPNPLQLPTDRPEDVPDVKVWDVTTGAELQSFRLPGKGPGLALSPDGETLAVSFGDTGVAIRRNVVLGKGRAQVMTTVLAPPNADVVRLYEVATGKEVAVLKGHTRPPWCVAFSPDGKRIVTGGGADQTIKLWDARTGQEIITVGRHADYVTSVAFSTDGRKIVSTSDDGDVRVWDATPLKK
jgi:WD40 repeat protein/serine/threonine protein kinase